MLLEVKRSKEANKKGKCADHPKQSGEVLHLTNVEAHEFTLSNLISS
jgi:hypothetical protein